MGAIGELDAVTIDCRDPAALSSFWASLLGTTADAPNGDPPHYVDLAPRPGLPVLRFQRVPEAKTVKNRLHLDIAVGDLDAACERIRTLGGRVVEGTFSEYGYRWRVVADPESNEFCVVVPPA